MKLNEIKDNQGARSSRKRLGRGIGSGKGKTSGKGHKGQRARTGISTENFEGGQTPIYMRLPKRGFNKINPREVSVINLSDLQKYVDSGKIDAKDKVTEDFLYGKRLVRKAKHGVKLLAKGALKASLSIEVTYASKAAQEAVKKAGGSVTVAEVAAAAPAA